MRQAHTSGRWYALSGRPAAAHKRLALGSSRLAWTTRSACCSSASPPFMAEEDSMNRYVRHLHYSVINTAAEAPRAPYERSLAAVPLLPCRCSGTMLASGSFARLHGSSSAVARGRPARSECVLVHAASSKALVLATPKTSKAPVQEVGQHLRKARGAYVYVCVCEALLLPDDIGMCPLNAVSMHAACMPAPVQQSMYVPPCMLPPPPAHSPAHPACALAPTPASPRHPVLAVSSLPSLDPLYPPPAPVPQLNALEVQVLTALSGARGRGREGLGEEQLEQLNSAIERLEADGGVAAPTTLPSLDGKWRLLYTSRPGSASPIQRTFTGIDSFSVFQEVELAGEGLARVNNVVDFGPALGYLKVRTEVGVGRGGLAWRRPTRPPARVTRARGVGWTTSTGRTPCWRYQSICTLHAQDSGLAA